MVILPGLTISLLVFFLFFTGLSFDEKSVRHFDERNNKFTETGRAYLLVPTNEQIFKSLNVKFFSLEMRRRVII